MEITNYISLAYIRSSDIRSISLLRLRLESAKFLTTFTLPEVRVITCKTRIIRPYCITYKVDKEF